MVTIHDVAQRAGVSPVTVSRVINGVANVNPETRARVERAIRELGYLPNRAARSLRVRQTHTLALLVPDITNAFWTTVARGVEDAAQTRGYSVLLCNTDENPVKQSSYLEAVLQQRVDGVVLAPCDTDPSRLAALQIHQTPAVLIDRRVTGWDGDWVISDSLGAARALVDHLVRLGRRAIAMVTGPRGASTAEDRVAGYRLALLSAGLAFDPRLVRYGEFRAPSGREQTHRMLDEGLRPDAILAANNVLAMGVLEALNERGLHVPQDIALVCFDELPDLAKFFPFLTVAAQPAYDMGLNAAQLLLSRIDAAGPLQPRQVVLPVRLVLRYSCGRLLQQEEVSPKILENRSESVIARPLLRNEVSLLESEGGEGLLASVRSFRQAGRSLLSRVLYGEAVERIPYLELDFPGQATLEYVLERALAEEVDAQNVSPEDWLGFALRAGVDAIPCLLFSHRTGALPPVFEWLYRIEKYMRAAQNSGVEVYLSLLVPEQCVAQPSGRGEECTPHLVTALRTICDRFAEDLPLVMLRGLPGHALQAEVLAGLIAPMKEHAIPTAVELPVQSAGSLASLVRAGVTAVVAAGYPLEELAALKRACGEQLVVVGGPLAVWMRGSRREVEQVVKDYCTALSPGGRCVFSIRQSISGEIAPEPYSWMLRTLRAFHGENSF
ncbi:MAG TPA: LacI family DNA-binding transcriptional regulator [Anaerolinea thermolimosa]|uniref:LacI family DNA-binding transcriptional regulator n=1 Tax=Anaerolinea thermolimosa TaxID=229919 RepID=A0A3D1JJH1_9CHLR|nr:LacI family DNA-binding transcriptional regulator [Anaerolinea thermolimosa]GAP05252.1 transcriptional regulators [Anaerolinea thermolimosa]HCE18387.1 LacI family DNA-binding transcriptional regulator [Anaerolinea thermolimosa]